MYKINKTDCCNYQGIPLLTTTYKILFNILLSWLTPYVDETIGNHQCDFNINRSITDHIIRIHQIPDKKWDYNEAVHQLFVDFKKSSHSIKREVVYNILIKYDTPKKQVRLIKLCLNKPYSKAHIRKHLSDAFPIQNGLKHHHYLLFCFKICH